MMVCPSISETTFGLTFLPSRSVAQVCLRSWNRMVGRAALMRSGAKDRFLRLEGCKSAPLWVAKTRPPILVQVAEALHIIQPALEMSAERLHVLP